MNKNINNFFKNSFSKTYIIKAILGIIALAVVHFIASFLSQSVLRLNNKDEPVKKSSVLHILRSVIYWGIMIIATLIVLSLVGIEGATIIAVLGSLLFAIGLGLQGTLGDLAAGIMLIVGNVYKIGDYVEVFGDGNIFAGTVSEFNIMYTRIVDDDSGIIIAIPNRFVYSNIVKNHSSSDKHVVVQVLTVSNKNKYLSDALEKLKRDVQSSKYVLSEPPVSTNISAITNIGTEIEVRYTLRASDYYTSGTTNVSTILNTIMRQSLIDSGVELVILSSIVENS